MRHGYTFCPCAVLMCSATWQYVDHDQNALNKTLLTFAAVKNTNEQRQSCADTNTQTPKSSPLAHNHPLTCRLTQNRRSHTKHLYGRLIFRNSPPSLALPRPCTITHQQAITTKWTHNICTSAYTHLFFGGGCVHHTFFLLVALQLHCGRSLIVDAAENALS